MATGYTYDVKDGTITKFETFALRCARAFGALIEMRDDAMTAPIPDEFKPSTYHRDELSKAKLTLAALKKLTPKDCERRADAEYAQAMESWNAMKATHAIERARYEAMLAEVRAWEPPSPEHVGLKTFMVEQLSESILHDCGDDDRWKPKKVIAAVWRAHAMERAERDVAYHEEHWKDEQRRAADRSTWVRQLKESLGLVTAGR